MSIKIKRFLANTYPEHAELIMGLQTVKKIQASPTLLPEAVVRVVAGQMLSGAAARTIYSRIVCARDSERLIGSWQLNEQSLRECGLSTSKAQAIVRFGQKIGNNKNALEYWRDLSIDDLFAEVKSHKGMGDWTAGIIALSYIGHGDVFPRGDGSLKKAVDFLTNAQRKKNRKYVFEPYFAQPYRSYLARYLWQALDGGILV